MIEQYIDKDFHGCVLVTQHQNTLHSIAKGYADFANQIPNEIDTKFATASAGKVFVAVAILQLIEQGKLKLSDTIGTILKFDFHQISKEITIEQLLTHTSGIPDYFDESVMEGYAELWEEFPNYKIRSSKDLIPLFVSKPMMYTPGERFQYNNTGYVVLSLIIEEVTGLAFDEYLEQQIFNPCNMNNTGYYELDRLPAKCANSYIWDENRKEFYTNIYSVDVKGTGAGGAFTTVTDIANFWDHLLNNKLLSKEMTAAMLSRQSGDDEDHYGYGIWLLEKNGAYSPFFQGSDPGVSFLSVYDAKTDITITAVSNFGCNVWKLFGDIRTELKLR